MPLLLELRVFKLLASPEYAAEVAAAIPCMRSPFDKYMLTTFASIAALQSDLAMAILLCIAYVGRLDTVPLECRFGFIKRINILSSLSHTQSFATASAKFVLTIQRIIESRYNRTTSFEPKAEECKYCSNGSPQSQTKEKEKQFQGGGAWRAWLSQWLHTETGDRRLDFRAAATCYNDLKERGGPEWEELQRVGKWGYEARRAGGRAFAKPDPNLSRNNAAQHEQDQLDQLEQDQLVAAFSQDPLSAESSCTDALKTLAIFAADDDAEAAMRAERAAREFTSEKRRQAKAERERRQDLWDRMERLNTQKQCVPNSNLLQECTHRPSLTNGVVLQDIEMPVAKMLDQLLRRSDKTLISDVMQGWTQDSAFIRHDACPKLPTKSPPVNTECYNANTCLCDAKGKVTKDCLKQWQSTISKGLENQAGPLRRYYDDGTLIIEFYSDTCESTFVNTAWLNLTTMRGSFHHPLSI